MEIRRWVYESCSARSKAFYCRYYLDLAFSYLRQRSNVHTGVFIGADNNEINGIVIGEIEGHLHAGIATAHDEHILAFIIYTAFVGTGMNNGFPEFF